MKSKLRKSTIVRDPDFHDGTLTGIVLRANRSLDLHCATVDARQYVVRIPQVDRLRTDNFREGNVVFELVIHEPPFSAELVKKVHGEGNLGFECVD